MCPQQINLSEASLWSWYRSDWTPSTGWQYLCSPVFKVFIIRIQASSLASALWATVTLNFLCLPSTGSGISYFCTSGHCAPVLRNASPPISLCVNATQPAQCNWHATFFTQRHCLPLLTSFHTQSVPSSCHITIFFEYNSKFVFIFFTELEPPWGQGSMADLLDMLAELCIFILTLIHFHFPETVMQIFSISLY